MKKVRVGFIGVGGIAELHLKKLQQLDTVELTAVCDINAERARSIGQACGAEPFTDWRKMIDAERADALFVCTPPFARDDIEETAAAKGIHLLVEKPVGLDLDTARRKSRAIREAGIINSSGYCLRYLESVQRAKQYLRDKPINMVLTYRIGSLPPIPWWIFQDKSGGQMVDQTTHQVDLVRYLAGEFREATARYAQRSIRGEQPEATIPDVGVVSFAMRSGAIGSLANSCVSRHYGKGDVELFGPDFYLAVSGTKLTIRDDNRHVEETFSTDFYLEQDRAFIEAVRTGRQELVLGDYAEAVETLAATLAFNKSAEAGRTVVIGD